MDVVAAALSEPRRDQGSREVPTGGPLPVDGSAGVDGGDAPAAVLEPELEQPEMESTPHGTPLACSSSSSFSCLRLAVLMELVAKDQVPMELAPSP